MSSDIKGAFRAHAAADEGIAAIVGTRIYAAGEVPQKPTAPYAVYQLISDPPVHHQGGKVAGEVRLQVTCYAATNPGVTALRDAFETAFAYLNGTMGAGGYTATVLRVFTESFGDLIIAPTDASAQGPCGGILDLLIWQQA